MQKIKISSLIFLFWITFLSLPTFATDQKDRRVVDSCRVLSSHFKVLIQNGNLIEGIKTPEEASYFIDDWELKASSTSYFVDYEENSKVLTLVKWPKDPQWSTVDFNSAKVIWKIKLPKDFQNVQVRFFKESTIIIFAEHYDADWKIETVALFYDLSDDKLTASYYFANTWKLVKLHVQNGKLYLVTNSELSKTMAENFIKKDWDLPSIFPKFSEGLKLGLITNEKTSVCKNYKYLYKPSDQMPSFWNIVVINLNNLKNTKEFLYYIGTLSQFQFAEKSMYLSIEWDNWTTIVQKFWLDPKINAHSSYILSWELLNNWILTYELKSAFITVQSSWKLNVYTLTTMNENFEVEEELEIYSWTEDFDVVEYQWTTVFLKNKEKAIAVAERWEGWSLKHEPLELPIKNHHYFLISWSPMVLLDWEQRNNKIYFSLLEKDKPQWVFRNLYTSAYANPWTLWNNFSWNQETQTLIFSATMESEEWPSTLIKAIQVPSNWRIKEIMARTYNNPTFRVIDKFQEFSYVITEDLFDMFIPSNPMAMRVLPRW